MLRYVDYDIVFQEIPDEVTLAINLSNCPNRCKGCHSPHLLENVGESLTEESLGHLLQKYGKAVTCVCFMGGDAEPFEVERLAGFLHRQSIALVKVGWYSGKNELPEGLSVQNFEYIKLGPYIEKLGGLKSPDTNQHFYRIYGEMGNNTKGVVKYIAPKDVPLAYLWLVVMGAPTEHWMNPISGEKDAQWPYKIKITGSFLLTSAN